MNKLTKTASLIIGLSLISSTAFAAELSVSYGKNNKLSLGGSGFESPTVAVTVAPSANEAYTSSTPFAFLAEKNCDINGSFEITTGLSSSAASGYYDAAVYDAALGEVKETFFFCNPAIASDELLALGGTVTLSDLTENAADLGISDELGSLDADKLIKYFNQFKPSGTPNAIEFTSAYIGALLCGAKDYTFDEFLYTVQNNIYALGCEDNPFFAYSNQEQQLVYSELRKLDISSSSFNDALYEASFLIAANGAQTKAEFESIIFDEFDNYLNLNTSDYSKLKSPEKVIASLMNTTYSSAEGFKTAYNKAVKTQKAAEEKKPSASSSGGGTSSKGSYDSTIVPAPNPGTSVSPDAGDAPSSVQVFDDMTAHWAKDAVMYLKEKGIVAGKGDNRFDPEAPVSRAEFSKMIAEALYPNSVYVDESYDDVGGSDWFAKYVYALSTRGIVYGVGNGNFEPHASVTRQDAAVIIKRAAKFSAISLQSERGTFDFADKANIADYAVDAVDTLYSAGLINGMGDGSFTPLSGITRAQAAQMIYNLLTK